MFQTQKELFNHIRQVRPHRCVICWLRIMQAVSRCFSHILGKGMFPKLKLYENNIALVCSIKCHKELDRRVSGSKDTLHKVILSWEIPNLDDYTGKDSITVKSD